MEYKIDTTLVFKNKVKGFSISEKRKIKRFIELFAEGDFEKIDNYQIQSYRYRCIPNWIRLHWNIFVIRF